MTDKKNLTPAQYRRLSEVVSAGKKKYNGRLRKTVEKLEALGLVESEFDLVPHVSGNGMSFTERFTVTPTRAGVDFIAQHARS